MATDAPAAAPRPAFEGIDSDEVITQISVGKKQVWAINRMGANLSSFLLPIL